MTITVKNIRDMEVDIKISLDYFKVFPGQGKQLKIDDRDSRIQYGSAFKTWTGGTLLKYGYQCRR